MQRVTVLGAGSFGTALAQLMGQQGLDVRMWMRNSERAATIQATRKNPQTLQEFTLSERIFATGDMEEALHGAEGIVLAIPSQSARSVLKATKLPEVPLVLAAKGIENESLMTVDEVVADVLGKDVRDRTLTLSGPSFAREMMRCEPTAVALACRDLRLADTVSARISGGFFRAYTTTDVIGVELGGALKNVMAIAAGAVTGMGLGDNARAALITRGLAEITRLAVSKGAHPMTLAGLSGFGDLVLTCTGGLSRNRAIGEALGRGKSLDEAIAEVKQVVEGIRTTESAYQLAKQLDVDAPITSAVYRVIYEGANARKEVANLLMRPLKRELEY
ncbi:MAG: NAD(P)-dependent glycerol-3-phosphate dehydrogenase [Clostridia bacterium]|nr:NAD(P)-dependent glycerol-3-phosphate dehydrogenase [Deltaproteobacteria bacterium]